MKLQFRSNHEKWTYFAYKRPAAAACAILLYKDEVLIAKRTMKSAAHPGEWSLPGGFLDADKETLEQCCIREIKEELGIDISELSLDLLCVDSGPLTDPRTHVVCVFYVCNLPEKCMLSVADDVIDARWESVHKIANDGCKLAFNHNKIMRLYMSRKE